MFVVRKTARVTRPWLDLATTTALGVAYPEKMREQRQTLGGFRMMEGTGKYRKDALEVSVRGGFDGWGRKTDSFFGRIFTQTTAASVKQHIRRVRPQEALAIAEIDGEIETLQEQLRQARKRRGEAVREAFNHGANVPLKSLLPPDGEHFHIVEDAEV